MHNRSIGCNPSQTSPSVLSRAALLFLIAIFGPASGAFADTLIWSGGGTTANWSDSGNWFGVVPNNGDILVFQGGQPRPNNTNNIVGLTLNQIRFIGASGGYIINGNSFGLSNTVSSIEGTNSAGVNQINNNITVPSPNLVVNVAPAAKLILVGVLSGPGGLVKNGGGTNELAGPLSNTYTGTTTVNTGLMELLKAGSPPATAIPADLVIGNGLASATVRNLTVLEIADTANLTINSLGTWDLNGNSETIGPNLTLNGGSVIGSATATLSPNNTITVNNSSSITANLNVNGGTCTIQNNFYLSVSGVISGAANITKNGGGSMLFDNQNIFSGTFTANGDGYVWITHPLGLGTGVSSTFNDDTSLAIDGNITVTNALALNSISTLAIQNFASDTNTWSGPVTFGTNSTIWVVTNGSFIITGTASGPGGFTKTGPGLLTLSGSGNSYLGDTTVKEGILLLNAINAIRYGTLTIGDGIGYNTNGAPQPVDIVRYLVGGCIFGGPGGSSVVIKSTGWLDLNNFFDDVGPITMDGGQITTGPSGRFQLFEPFNTIHTDPTNNNPLFTGHLDLFETSHFGMSNFSALTINGPVTSSSAIGSSSLIKNGNGTLYLTSSNSYTGPTIVQEGILYVQNAFGLGTTDSGTVVSNQATLALSGINMGITNESLTLNGTGISSVWGALDIETFGTNFWVGPITLNVDSTITAYYSGSSVLHIIGSIGGSGGMTTLASGAGIIYLDGLTGNTYGGTTRVFGGTLLLNKPGIFDGTIPHDLIIGDGAGGPNADVVRLLTFNQIPNLANVTINSSGLLDLNTSFEGLGTITGTGNIALGTQYLDMYGTTTYQFDGVISGPGAFHQVSTGTAILTATNTYAGPTAVANSGSIIVNGYQPQSPVQVTITSGSFGGSGTVGDISCVGHLRPGGVLTCGNVALAASATFHETISGRNPGPPNSGYSQLNVRGTNNLANAALAIGLALTNPISVGDQLVMINNDGVDPITGIFAGYLSGSSYSANGFTFVISYTGSSGNDVVLTVTNISGAVVSSSVSAGNGDHIIGPNECNNLSIVVSNSLGVARTGPLHAVLSASTFGVEVTQPYSTYPSIPANGTATNTFPFQISTLPAFTCGQDINLQLSVYDYSYGSFTVPFVIHTGTPGNVPVRFDVSTATNIPDIGTIESTNVVTGFSSLLAKVGVSMWLTHPVDSDLSISLISPNGTTVNLTSGNGGGANFGSSCSPDANRTTFDDSGLVSITAGTPPFTGTFRPQAPLSSFFETPVVNGNWRLHVTDSFGGSIGALRCWSLLLYPFACAPGSGICGLCSPPITGSLTNTDPVQIGRLTRDGNVASCGIIKPYPGTIDSSVRHYRAYSLTNTSGADACLTVELAASCDVQAIAYLGTFDPTNINNNYLGDSGTSTGGGSTNSFSFNFANGQVVVIAVDEVTPNAGCDNFTLTLSGLPCPAPSLSVEDVPTAKAHLFWPNSAGGYILESSPLVDPTTWSAVTNEPIISGGNYNVTNTTAAPSQFYRLRKQ